MPLFRYTGCNIRVYRPLDIDLVIKFQRCYPMCCTKLMYTGCQPSLMMMSKGSKIIRCKKNAPNAKPYVKFKFPPPDQMTNKWYFQHNESNTGLLMIQVAAVSLDHYYTSSYAESSTVTLWGINTRIFQNLNFANPPTYGYIPKSGFTLYATNGADKVEDLIWLGQSKKYNKGDQLKQHKLNNNFDDTVKQYMQHSEWWGNPFHSEMLHQQWTLWKGTSNPLTQLTNKSLNFTSTCTQAGLTKLSQELFFKFRYNPFKDKGYNNIYILANFTDNLINDKYDLEPYDDPDLQNPGFPNWLGCFGFQDYLIKLGKKQRINTDYIMLMKTKAIEPLETYYILVDEYFLHGDSEELIGRTDWDNENWYPMIQHQQGALNTLALCGPGAPKLGDIKTAEAKLDYSFHFKVGGCSKAPEKVTDPTTQPTFVTPNNILNTNSLQSPDEPIETFLYQFDWRRDQITQSAAQRITKDHRTKTTLFTDAERSATEVPTLQTQEKELLSSEEEETKKETLFEQLQHQRLKQRELRLRIKQLLNQLQELE
ncbi:MAG: hypothetical protein [Anelloviridae sp.]|nr:MAG: hypothetical protein [Anelloviridae sp.]